MGKYTRRGFLVVSVAVAGGVVFGVRTYRSRLENPLTAGLQPGEAALTPYVKITADGVTIITPRAEMGQGIHTTLAALVAEELDIDLADITVDHGPASSVYYNGGVVEEGYPFPTTDTGALAEFARSQRDIPAVFLGYQITGGSTSTHDAYHKMREAGAVARETLKAAAAARTGLSVAQLTTMAGAVVLPDGTRLPYTDLATIDLSDAPELRPRSAWRILGTSQDRIDVIDKSTGRAVYASFVLLASSATAQTAPSLNETGLPEPGTVSLAQGQAAWTRIRDVRSHPRCLNCHVGPDNIPLWTTPPWTPQRKHGMHITAAGLPRPAE